MVPCSFPPSVDNAMSDLSPLPTEPRPGLYSHYKGNDYRVLGLPQDAYLLFRRVSFAIEQNPAGRRRMRVLGRWSFPVGLQPVAGWSGIRCGQE